MNKPLSIIFLLLMMITLVSGQDNPYGTQLNPQQPYVPIIVVINASSILNINNSLFWGGYTNQQYNDTFIQPYSQWFYNQTIPAINTLNGTYGKFWYNQTYGGSTFNTSYNNLLNQSCPAGKVINGTLINGTFICTTVAASGNFVPYEDANQTVNLSTQDLVQMSSEGDSSTRTWNSWTTANGGQMTLGSTNTDFLIRFRIGGRDYFKITDPDEVDTLADFIIANNSGQRIYMSVDRSTPLTSIHTNTTINGTLQVLGNVNISQNIYARNLCYANGTNSSGQNCSTVMGGGTPGGSAGQLQYNNGGSFGGIANTVSSATTVTFFNGSAFIVDDGTGNGFILQSPIQNEVGAYDNVNAYPIWNVDTNSFSLFQYANKKITYSTDTGDITFSNVNTYFDSNAGYGLQLFDGSLAGLKTLSGNLLAEYDFVGNNYLYGTGLQVNGNTNAVTAAGNIYISQSAPSQIVGAVNPAGASFPLNLSGGGSGMGAGGNNGGLGLNIVACNSTTGSAGCWMDFYIISQGQTTNNATTQRNTTLFAEFKNNNATFNSNIIANGSLYGGNVCYNNGTNCNSSSFVMNYQEEFLGTSGFTDMTTAAANGASTSAALGETNHPGIFQLSTGTTTQSGVAVVSGAANAIMLGGGKLSFTSIVKFPVASNSTETYKGMTGLSDVTSGDATDGVYFRYTSANSGFWQLVTRNNGAETSLNSTVPVGNNTWYRLYAEVNSTAGKVDFYIDGTNVGNITTNIPSTAGRNTGIEPAQILKTLGTNSTAMYVDYFNVYQEFTVQR